MRSTIHTKVIDLRIYNSKIVIIIGKSAKILNDYVNNNIIKIDISEDEGCVFENTNGDVFTYYMALSGNFLSHNLIAHETFHLAYKITENSGIQNEEASAWLIGYLTELIYGFLYESKIRLNKTEAKSA